MDPVYEPLSAQNPLGPLISGPTGVLLMISDVVMVVIDFATPFADMPPEAGRPERRSRPVGLAKIACR